MTADGTATDATTAPAAPEVAAARELIAQQTEVVRQLHAEHQRMLTVLRTELDAQRGELDGAQQQIQVLSGRTERHETGQQLARDATRELEALRERMETESAQRRELAQRLLAFIENERAGAAEREAQQQALADRVQSLTERSELEGDHLRRLQDESATRESAALGTEERLAGVERDTAAGSEVQRRAAEQLSRLVAATDSLRTAVDEMATRLGVLASDYRQLGEEVGSLRAIQREEAALVDALEQQRVQRHRLEARLADLEERLAAESARLDAQNEAVSLLRGDATGLAERLRALDATVEGQRESMVEHVRRSARAQEQAAGRRSAELDREVRVANELLARLAEAPLTAREEQEGQASDDGAAEAGR